MLRLAKFGRRAVDLRPWVDQVDRIELLAAVVALVAAGVREAAVRARSLDVAVGEGVARGCRECAERRPLEDEPTLVQRAKNVADDAAMIRRRRPREQVVAQPEPPKILPRQLVVLVRRL